ncbi:hypothetical protein [Acidithiobacillus ferrooxidans]|nr:hypothetical protein [Acidithiobacillus ferrooxidans]
MIACNDYIVAWIEDGTMAGAQCPDRRGATDVVWKVSLNSLEGRIFVIS